MRHVVYLVISALLAASAGAGDLPTSYRVSQKDLKKGAVAGDMLTFTLYRNDTCTDAFYQAVLPIEGVTLISRLKLERVKNGPKPPSVTELRQTLVGVDPVEDVYLEVTGAGVTPVGGPCQAQQSTPPSGVFAYGQIRGDGLIRNASPELDTVTHPGTGQYCLIFGPIASQLQLEGSVVGQAGGSPAVGHVRVTNGQAASFTCPPNSLMVEINDATSLRADGRFTFIVP